MALLGAFVAVLGMSGLDFRQKTAEADVATPGGISALPSAAPGIPGVMNQGIPAIIRARQPGNVALVSVFCDPQGQAPKSATPGGFPSLPCASTDDDVANPITFKISRIYPPDGAPASTFQATGTAELTCLTGPLVFAGAGGGPCDYNRMLGVVVVQVNGGGVNEIVQVTATDAIGESRSVDIVVVDTILAWGPSGVLSTAAQNEPAFVSYACDIIGRQNIDTSLSTIAEAFGDGDGVLGLDDLWELYYNVASGLNLGKLDNNLGIPGPAGDIDVPLWWCGGDTGSLADDFVTFQTDLGIFSVDPAGVSTAMDMAALAAQYGLLLPPTLDVDCSEGKDINTADVDSLAVWGLTLLSQGPEGGCDADFARNGVVTTSILGNGEVGVATITAQQGGGVSPPRTINLTFAGEAALSVFIEAPESISVEGGKFKVMVVDQDGRPVGDETLQCTVEPADRALVAIPQTGTTNSVQSEDPGSLTITLVPTGKSVASGEQMKLTCVLDRNRSISATATVGLSTTPGLETVNLPAACSLVGSTWDDGTAVSAVATAVIPAEALKAIWSFDPATGTWVGFSPAAPAGASDLTTVDRLEPLFICMSEPGTVGRPLL
jgi:hypothetical protein